ncbi:MAG: CHASE3 domain-containing protein [Deltaproteobacteria bacterium]|nr:CHASE3 domain-containing protein [Deltaproteobacteria bacterium]
MVVLACVLLWRLDAQVASFGWVEHTYQVIRETKHAQTDLFKMTIAIRSYWLSGEKRYLTEFGEEERDLDASMDNISTLVADNPAQRQRVLEGSSLKGKWIGVLQMLVMQRNASQPAISLLQLGNQFQAVSSIFDEIADEEDRLLIRRSARQRTENEVIFILVPLLSLLAGGLLTYWDGTRSIGPVRDSAQLLSRQKKRAAPKIIFSRRCHMSYGTRSIR